jgi:hypothetical protein
MELVLTRSDREILVATIEHAVSEISTEARRSSTRDYRKRLEWERGRLKGILQQLEDEETFETEALEKEPELELDFGEREPTRSDRDAYLISAMMGPH